MIFIVAVTVFIGICALSLVGLGESHMRVTRLLEELEADSSIDREAEVPVAATACQTPKLDAFSELGFTRSLLALSKVRLLYPYDFPAPVNGESSSLASIRPRQSKSRERDSKPSDTFKVRELLIHA